jgi:hypothetical protein
MNFKLILGLFTLLHSLDSICMQTPLLSIKVDRQSGEHRTAKVSPLAALIRDEHFGAPSSQDHQAMLEKALKVVELYDPKEYQELEMIFVQTPQLSPRSGRIRYAKPYPSLDEWRILRLVTKAFEIKYQDDLQHKATKDQITLKNMLGYKQLEEKAKKTRCCCLISGGLSLAMLSIGAIGMWAGLS